jgi:hypothetical protein
MVVLALSMAGFDWLRVRTIEQRYADGAGCPVACEAGTLIVTAVVVALYIVHWSGVSWRTIFVTLAALGAVARGLSHLSGH